MISLTAQSINEIQVALCSSIMKVGEDIDPRGMHTREILGSSFVLEQPRNRLTTLKTRKWSAALAVAELAWHLRADDDVSALEFYTPRWRDFADDSGLVKGSCYGARIFKSTNGISQWEAVKKLLQADPSSRRAILNFRIEEDVSRVSNDISCTNTLQFLLRDNQLHAFVSMRSNDVIWGVPYDAFLFTSLQELMAVELGVEVGKYCHHAASMHIYARHFILAERIAKDQTTDLGGMPRIKSVDEVKRMAAEEANMRLHKLRQSHARGSFEARCMALLSSHHAFTEAA